MGTMTLGHPAGAGATRRVSDAAVTFVATLASRLQPQKRDPRALRIDEAARVRRFAQRVMADDPRFAADLYAAADRHDGG